MAFLREVLMKIRRKGANEMSIEETLAAYRLLLHVRKDLVESFYNIAERRLREVYDDFSMTMLKLDKTIQTLRRILENEAKISIDESKTFSIDENIQKLSLETSLAFRSLLQNAKLLKEFSQSMPHQYLRAILRGVDDAIDKVIKILGGF
ncbi:hypothetical protein QPL79_06245 [Ignisphaera sp. 4213-co]|uniref:DUF47 family protein n=1 Tax=Ignisphaera cupida TaxID=3050454 RepID=A0ABD4Z749_9CREN|nr:hypothetical protein [Ignisphaera sp. 4213-co]MDK6028959.1 hypothetical protein [Ignisphaera sp. 4213-co]